jgi:uncharacterized protein
MLSLWAVLCLGGGLYASWHGYGGRAFAATLTAFALYLAMMLLLAARGVPEFLLARLGANSGYLLGATIILGYAIYAVGTNTLSLARLGAVGAFVAVPLMLAASARQRAAGAWQDYLTLAGVWVAVKSSSWHLTPQPLAHWLWPYPGGRLAYVFTILLALNTALAAFMLIRRLSGIGYSIGWGRRWGVYILGSFLVFGAIAIPLGTGIHFIQFAPRWAEWKSFLFVFVAILWFTAWPEEFLFRGLLQNILSKSTKSDAAGWWTASVLFGFSHITNMGFPNWRYVILASIAGLFYGWTWRKTGSIFGSGLVHALVDATWHFLFRTL